MSFLHVWPYAPPNNRHGCLSSSRNSTRTWLVHFFPQIGIEALRGTVKPWPSKYRTLHSLLQWFIHASDTLPLRLLSLPGLSDKTHVIDDALERKPTTDTLVAGGRRETGSSSFIVKIYDYLIHQQLPMMHALVRFAFQSQLRSPMPPKKRTIFRGRPGAWSEAKMLPVGRRFIPAAHTSPSTWPSTWLEEEASPAWDTCRKWALLQKDQAHTKYKKVDRSMQIFTFIDT